jgi:beta-carotene 3-hydroxylase
MLLLSLIAFLGAFIGMEGMAWLVHKYVMHGFLWILHDDHHYRDDSVFFEKNDAFFLIFSIPGMAFIFSGVFWQIPPFTGLGLGITAYGACYFLVHDVFIHQRFKWFRSSNNRYLRAVRRAHKVHHKNINKHDGQSFGMLFFPMQFWREAKSK